MSSLRASAALLLVFAHMPARAQPAPTPSPALAVETKTVQDLLASTDPAALAWGAYLAGNYRLPSFSADLLRLATSSDWRVRMAAVDTLLRLDIEMPQDVLTRMVEVRLDEVLIAIARRPDRYPQLVDQLLARKLGDVHWVALHGILLSRPPAGFAAKLLREWTIRLEVSVHDLDSGGRGGLLAGLSTWDGGSFEQPGFPPLRAYFITDSPQPGDTLLAQGPHPVGYRTQAGGYGSSQTINRDAYRADYLGYLAASLPGEIRNESVQWLSERDFRTRMESLRLKVRGLVASLKRDLLGRGLLSGEDAATLDPGLEVRVVDRRTRQVPPLPAIRWTLRD